MLELRVTKLIEARFRLRPMRFKAFLFAAVVLGLLGACGEISTPGEELRLAGQALESAYLGEPYSAVIRTSGGLSPYRHELSAGRLPPGMTLQGNTLRGTPTELGSYTFTITVSDANLSKTFREYTLQVLERPPVALRLHTPATEMRSPFRLRGEVVNARELQGLRTLIRWDAERFALVEGSVVPTRRDVVLLHQLAQPGELHVDLAVLGEALTGDQRLFELELRPRETSTIEVTARTEFMHRDERHAFATLREGARPAPGVPAAPEDPFEGIFDDLDDEFDEEGGE